VNLYWRFSVYAVLGCLTLLNLLVLPAMVGVLADHTLLTEAQSGWAASVNFLAASMVALFMALRMHRLHLRHVAIAGLLLAAASDVASAYAADSLDSFLACRFMAGMGTGAAYTVVVAAFARLPEVDRGYGVFITLQFIVSGLGLYILPVYSANIGFSGMFFAFAALEIAAVVLCLSLPGKPALSESHDAHIPRRTELQVLLAASTLLGVLGFAVFEAANVAQFTYVERLGAALDLNDHQIGLVLGIGSLAGIPGAFAIVLMGRRFGRIKPLSLGIVLAITGLLLLIKTDAFALYLAGSCLLGFSWAFCLPYIQGLLAGLDSGGSAVAAGAATSTVGGAIGPGLAALFVGDGLYDRVFVMTIVLFIAAWLSLWFANRSARRHLEGTS
jgi:predicted MFS family arabinose efflux permease